MPSFEGVCKQFRNRIVCATARFGQSSVPSIFKWRRGHECVIILGTSNGVPRPLLQSTWERSGWRHRVPFVALRRREVDDRTHDRNEGLQVPLCAWVHNIKSRTGSMSVLRSGECTRYRVPDTSGHPSGHPSDRPSGHPSGHHTTNDCTHRHSFVIDAHTEELRRHACDHPHRYCGGRRTRAWL